MLDSERLDGQIREQWRALGFHYDFDADAGWWTFTGSPDGLAGFPRLLRDYVADPRNGVQGEHEHYGPYFYLKVMTWPEPGINANAIYGSLADLARLSNLVEAKLRDTPPGSRFDVRDEYAPDAGATLVFDLRDAGFDPASLDPKLAVRTKPLHPIPDPLA